MPSDFFMHFDGIKGESTDDKHKEWVEVLSFSHGMSQPISVTKSSAGGAASGRTQHGDFVITKHVDLASPKLYEAISQGKHLGKVKLEACRAGGSQVKYFEVTLEQVMVSKVLLNTNGASNGSFQTESTHDPIDLVPVEEIHLNYGKIQWVYTQQKRADGSGGGNVSAGHDLTAGKAAS